MITGNGSIPQAKNRFQLVFQFSLTSLRNWIDAKSDRVWPHQTPFYYIANLR